MTKLPALITFICSDTHTKTNSLHHCHHCNSQISEYIFPQDSRSKDKFGEISPHEHDHF